MSDPTVERNKRNFRRFQEEIIVGGNMSLLPELVAPEMRILRSMDDSLMRLHDIEVPKERVWTHEQFKKFYSASLFKPLHHRRRILDIYGENDVVWARWAFEYDHNDERFFIPPTGKPVVQIEVGMIRFDADGRIVEGWFMSDLLETILDIGAKVSIEPGPSDES